jgi:hypothetical protein
VPQNARPRRGCRLTQNAGTGASVSAATGAAR